MKLGVMTVCLGDLPLAKALAYLKKLGVQEVEIGCGGFPGTAHADARELMRDPKKLAAFQHTVEKSGLRLAALACHGNPLHPQKEIAREYHEQFEAAVLLAEKLGVPTVVGFSGCPGDCDDSRYPNWVVSAWPNDFQTVLDWQWKEKLIPYWKKMAQFLKEHGGVRVALEMHPGFCVYNAPTLLRLREACGELIGANFDPSHLYWQGIDPVAAARALKGAIHHVHAKDTKIDPYICPRDGVLSTTSLGNTTERPWLFRTVGCGHSLQEWNDLFCELRRSGYDGIISIEHEDAIMTGKEGLEKAVSFLKQTLLFDETESHAYWA